MAETILSIGGGFLLAVLWFDLMFDVQALRAPGGAALPEPVLASIAGYYRRVTTDAGAMGRLVGAVMLATIAAALVEGFAGSAPLLRRLTSIALLVAPVALAGARVFPNARRLGARGDDAEEQSRLARAIARDHLACLAAIAAFLVLRLTA
jgi:hypothetical protein